MVLFCCWSPITTPADGGLLHLHHAGCCFAGHCQHHPSQLQIAKQCLPPLINQSRVGRSDPIVEFSSSLLFIVACVVRSPASVSGDCLAGVKPRLLPDMDMTHGATCTHRHIALAAPCCVEHGSMWHTQKNSAPQKTPITLHTKVCSELIKLLIINYYCTKDV